jgi:hypothetical protein
VWPFFHRVCKLMNIKLNKACIFMSIITCFWIFKISLNTTLSVSISSQDDILLKLWFCRIFHWLFKSCSILNIRLPICCHAFVFSKGELFPAVVVVNIHFLVNLQYVLHKVCNYVEVLWKWHVDCIICYKQGTIGDKQKS